MYLVGETDEGWELVPGPTGVHRESWLIRDAKDWSWPVVSDFVGSNRGGYNWWRLGEGYGFLVNWETCMHLGLKWWTIRIYYIIREAL